MATFRIVGWREGDTPVATLRARNSDTALSPTYTGSEIYSGTYSFDVGSLATGDYTVLVAGNRIKGDYVIRVTAIGVTVADNWIQLDTIAAIGSPLQVGDEYRWTNQDGDTIDVVIGEVP